MYVGTHSETQEAMVIYRQLYGKGGVWVRPASMWNEEIERNGVILKRFKYMGKSSQKSTRKKNNFDDEAFLKDLKGLLRIVSINGDAAAPLHRKCRWGPVLMMPLTIFWIWERNKDYWEFV